MDIVIEGLDTDSYKFVEEFRADLSSMNDIHFSVEKTHEDRQHKSVTLVVAIALVGAAATTINTVINLLKWYQEKQPTFAIKISRGDASIEVRNATQKMVDEFLSENIPGNICVEILKA